MSKELVFKGTDKKKIKDPALSEDFLSAEAFAKKVFLGKLGVYYKDFWVKYFIPYDYIHRAYKAVNIVEPQEIGPVSEYYRLILKHDNKEIANVIFNEHQGEMVDIIVHKICEIHPETAKGYVE